MMHSVPLSKKQARRDFSIAYLSVAALIAANLLFPKALQLLGEAFIPQLIADPSFALIYQYAGIFFVNVPLCMLILDHSAPPAAPRRRKLPAGKIVVYFTVVYFVAFVGSLIGNLVSLPFNYTALQDALASLMQSSVAARLLIVCIIGPFVEELFFRKFLIDRLGRYGPWAAILASSVMFALYHGNIIQFFYTFGIGLALGHLYVRSGRLFYVWFLHFLINLMSSVIAPTLMPWLFDTAASPDSFAPLLIYATFVYTVIIAGFVNLIVHRRAIALYPPRLKPLYQGWTLPAFINWGIVAAAAASIFYVWVASLS